MKNENEILNEIDIYISYHLICLNKLIKAFNGKTKPELTDCHSCPFGKKFNELKNINHLSAKIKIFINEIDNIHCDFHHVTYTASKEGLSPEKLEELNKISDLLVHKLLKLKMIIKNSN